MDEILSNRILAGHCWETRVTGSVESGYSDIILLPETIGDLERLKVINVPSSKIKLLRKALAKLKNLEELEASDCRQMGGNLPEEIGMLPSLKILHIEHTVINRVPPTINQLSHLKTLELHGIHEPQELAKLPTSLTNLSVTSLSLKSNRVPDLSYMTNLVSLSLYNESNNDSTGTLSPYNQTPQMTWLVKLTKLQHLSLDLPDLVLPPTDLSSLSHLQTLTITCFDLQSLHHLPSSLKQLVLINVKSPIDWQHLSRLNNLSSLQLRKCWLKEIKVDCLQHLHCLSLLNCELLERLSNLPCLKKLQKLHICNCPHLVDIEGVEELKSLQSLNLSICNSILQLPDILRPKKLVDLDFWCKYIVSIPDVKEEVPCRHQLLGCEHFRDFDGPYSECHRFIKQVGEIPEYQRILEECSCGQ